jgi:hypothetical protein
MSVLVGAILENGVHKKHIPQFTSTDTYTVFRDGVSIRKYHHTFSVQWVVHNHFLYLFSSRSIYSPLQECDILFVLVGISTDLCLSWRLKHSPSVWQRGRRLVLRD